MSTPIRPTAVLVVEPIDCKACNGTGYEPGHEPTEQGVPYLFCSTCQGVKVRHRAMPLEEFAKLFTWGQETIEDPNDGRPVAGRRVVTVAPMEGK